MYRKKLHDNWQMRQAGTNDFFPAKVPGSVYNDLLLNNQMEDPYYRDNELKALKLMENDYEYVTTFDIPEEILSSEKILLHFDGLATVADIYLNGIWLAYVENMHRTWEFSIKEQAKLTGNELKILFHSPIKYIKEANEKDPILGSTDAMAGFPYIRKAHCMFGWDWGPRLPDAGIWRDVELIGFSDARIDNVYITQKHAENSVKLTFDVEIERISQELLRKFGQDDEKLEGLSLQVTLCAPDGQKTTYSQEEVLNGILIENPQLWWPNGYGEQPLYTVTR